MMLDLSQSKVLVGLDEAGVLARLGAPDQAQARLVYHILPPNEDGVSGAWMDVVHENGKLSYIWPVGYGASKDPSPPEPSQLPWESMSTPQRVCAMQWMLANFPSMPSSPEAFRARFGTPTFHFVEWQYAADWGTCARSPHCYYVVRFQGGVVDSFGGND
ncbi:MAG: hypothetical protein EPO68_11580 [Planctomycetota bacterium]|nr:MAG: hypothetical protein EPO68_11580 [Planctomycetota bacterium]